MAVNIHVKIDDLKGESKDKGFEEQIDVLSWAWGMTQTGTRQYGGGGGTGKVSVQDLTITKRLDKATPELVLKCCNGKHYDKLELVVAKAGEDPLKYLTLTLENVLISSFQTGGAPGDEVIHENISFNFEKFKLEYVEQDSKGKGKAPVKTGWDIAANQKN